MSAARLSSPQPPPTRLPITHESWAIRTIADPVSRREAAGVNCHGREPVAAMLRTLFAPKEPTKTARVSAAPSERKDFRGAPYPRAPARGN